MQKKQITHGRFLNYGGSSIPSFCEWPGNRGRSVLPQLQFILLLLIAAWAVLGIGFLGWKLSAAPKPQLPTYMSEPVLISYSYFEKDAIQVCAMWMDVSSAAALAQQRWKGRQVMQHDPQTATALAVPKRL